MPPIHTLRPVRKIGPLFMETQFKDVKDPCICFDGTTWHIYGSGGDTYREEWEILHATAPSIEGPWTEIEPARLRGVEGPHVAAPTVMYDPEDKLFHMAVQKDFMDVGGGIAYLVSADGNIFTKMRTLVSPSGEREAGLYDPHFAVIKNWKYMVYSGIPRVAQQVAQQAAAVKTFEHLPFTPQPDVHLAKSTTDRWAGVWKRTKAILRHEDISWHHNRRDHPDYEWGIEGPQIVELPNGKVLLNATSFIEEGRRGTRQRVFFAIADDVKGPYTSLGPVLTTNEPGVGDWENGENGHASAIVQGDELYLFYQARSQNIAEPKEANDWRYGIAVFKIADIMKALEREGAAA
jgi:hypothetical protein